MIEKLEENDMLKPLVVAEKVNELINAFNVHYHTEREGIIFSTSAPKVADEVTGE